MEEDEYDDELPPISVNSSSQDEAVFAMPPAEVLASQRAREAECERELQELRARRERDLREAQLAASLDPVMAPSRSDSSGSEGEAALASAVEALRVRSATASPAEGAGTAALLAALAQRLPPAARAPAAALAAALRRGCDADELAHELAAGAGAWLRALAAPGRPADHEVVGVGAALAAAALRAGAAPARRALHALLDLATPAQVRLLADALVGGVESAAARLRLAGALPAAAPPAAALLRAALRALLLPPDATHPEICTEPLTLHEIAELVARGWRGVPAEQRELALRLCGRALAAAKHERERGRGRGREHERGREREREQAERAALARALAALEQPPPSARADRHQPDHLKIAVAASKLKIILSDRN